MYVFFYARVVHIRELSVCWWEVPFVDMGAGHLNAMPGVPQGRIEVWGLGMSPVCHALDLNCLPLYAPSPDRLPILHVSPTPRSLCLWTGLTP